MPIAQIPKPRYSKRFEVCLSAIVVAFTLTATGCSTTPAVKPTASVMVGAHTSL